MRLAGPQLAGPRSRHPARARCLRTPGSGRPASEVETGPAPVAGSHLGVSDGRGGRGSRIPGRLGPRTRPRRRPAGSCNGAVDSRIRSESYGSGSPRWFRSPRPPVSALGRNCGLFCAGMKWAGRRANEHCSVLAMLTATNEASYPNPLPWAEVAGIARSIERYRRQWIASGWAHRPAWLERQRARGQRGGKVSGCRRRARAAQLRGRGHDSSGDRGRA